MIDIVQNTSGSRKQIQQIGTPGQEERLYVEETVYRPTRNGGKNQRSVYVLVGHTECASGRYATYVEGAIEVQEITFQMGVPQWNNKAWNYVFLEMKRCYEEAIIVGWAVDRQGIVPEPTLEYERVHREQFGGAHQILLLMNSLEGEEKAYENKKNHLVEKPGFYIYYEKGAKIEAFPEERMWRRLETKAQMEPTVEEERLQGRGNEEYGKVRLEEDSKLMIQPPKRKSEPEEEERESTFAGAAMGIAMILMLGIIGVGACRMQLDRKEYAEPVVAPTTEEQMTYPEVEIKEVPGNIG